MKSIQYISSQSVDLRKHGSHINTTIKAIGVFDFEITKVSQPYFYIFSFANPMDTRTEFVIVPDNELFKRISLQNRYHITGNRVFLVLWFMPSNLLFDATNIGTEGEWWFIGGGMAEGTVMDFTCFFNNWDFLREEMN